MRGKIEIRLTSGRIKNGYYFALLPHIDIARFKEINHLRLCLTWLVWGMDIIWWGER
jgi:hypothetical protein